MKHNFLKSGWSAAAVACGIVLMSGCSSLENDEDPMPPGAYKPAASPDKQAVSTAEPVVISKATPAAPKPEDFEVLAPAMPKSVEKTAPKAVKAPAAAKDGTYVVKAGDSYWKIARKYHISEQALLAANNADASKPLRVGKKLVIPSGKAAATPAVSGKKKAAVKPAAKAAIPADGKYVVKRGDSFSKIAKKFGVRASDIAAANNMTLQSTLVVGKTLTIPKAGGSKVVTGSPKAKTGKNGKTAKGKGSKEKTDASVTQPVVKDAKEPGKETNANTASDVPAAPSLDGLDLPAAPATPAAVPAAPATPAAAPAAATPAAPATASSESGFTVTVPKDTTVEEIAKSYGCSVDEIRRLNTSLAPNGTVKAGSKINLY